MSKQNIILPQYCLNLPTFDDYYSISNKRRLDKHYEGVVMTYICEEDENNIDCGKNIIIKRGNLSFDIKPSDIYCYGVIDFDKDSEDMEKMRSFSWLDNDILKGFCVPANYDYSTHTCISYNQFPLWYDTFRTDIIAKYVHACLRKPERTLIFRHIC